MPRDANGSFSLVTGNPVEPDTIIEAAWANTTMPDIGNALTDSLSRTGQGGMLVPFKNADGVKASPGMTWVNEPTAGWYRKASGEFWYAIGNDDIFKISSAGIELSPGKTAVGVSAAVIIQDTQPIAVDLPVGGQWFESDDGSLWMKYRNPDSTVVLVGTNVVGGNFLPAAGLNTTLGDYADDAAAAVGGVAVGVPYRTGSVMKVRIT